MLGWAMGWAVIAAGAPDFLPLLVPELDCAPLAAAAETAARARRRAGAGRQCREGDCKAPWRAAGVDARIIRLPRLGCSRPEPAKWCFLPPRRVETSKSAWDGQM